MPRMSTANASSLSLWSAALVWLLCTTSGCEHATGRARFGGCESFVVKRAIEDHTAADVDCDLEETTWLVAVPKQRRSIHDFTVAGIPDTVGLALTQDADSARWCAINEVAPAQPPPHAPPDNDRYRQFDIDCATA